MSYGTLYLLPTLLGGEDIGIIPRATREITLSLTHFIVENKRSARRYLIKLGIKDHVKQIDDIMLYELDKHATDNTTTTDMLLRPILSGHHLGIISEAGCPAVADPGSAVVRRAHEIGIQVVPLIGPSALLLTLMASGMNGQNFLFHGYLPLATQERQVRIKQLEHRARREDQTQLFIETPYRNHALLTELLQTCQPDTRLCIAAQLTLPDQFICTLTIAQWRDVKELPNWHKKMLVFAIGR